MGYTLYTAWDGENKAQALADGGGVYLYAVIQDLGGTSGILKLLNKTTMAELDARTITHAHVPFSLLFDNEYLYFGHSYYTNLYPFDNAEVIKLDKFTFATVKTWWCGSTGGMFDAGYKSLAHDSTYIYFGVCYGTHSRVVKLLKSTMTTPTYWTNSDEDGPVYGPSLCHDGTYLYAGNLPLSTLAAGKIYKIDPSTMTGVSTWTGGVNEFIKDITYDASFIYAVTYNSPAKVFKISKSTMETVATWTGASGQNVGSGLYLYGILLYVGLETSPVQIVEVSTDTMVTVQTWTGDAGMNNASALAAGSVAVALRTSPATVADVTFARPPVVSDVRVGGLRHTYRPGSYRLELTLGGITTTPDVVMQEVIIPKKEEEPAPVVPLTVKIPEKTAEEFTEAVKADFSAYNMDFLLKHPQSTPLTVKNVKGVPTTIYQGKPLELWPSSDKWTRSQPPPKELKITGPIEEPTGSFKKFIGKWKDFWGF